MWDLAVYHLKCHDKTSAKTVFLHSYSLNRMIVHLWLLLCLVQPKVLTKFLAGCEKKNSKIHKVKLDSDTSFKSNVKSETFRSLVQYKDECIQVVQSEKVICFIKLYNKIV